MCSQSSLKATAQSPKQIHHRYLGRTEPNLNIPATTLGLSPGSEGDTTLADHRRVPAGKARQVLVGVSGLGGLSLCGDLIGVGPL